MARMVKVSVLVPVYNMEKYLAVCLDSLVNQTLKEIEIICINDGSTDDSLSILRKYEKEDSRIVVIDKKNSGYGASMNRGLEVAKGEFIGIVEPDDFVDLNTFEDLYEIASNTGAEVVKSDFYEFFTAKNKNVKSDMFLENEKNRVIDPRRFRNIFYQQPSIWSAIYRTDFIKENGIKFLESPGASYQDAGFNFKVWASARRVFLTDKAFLHYRKDNPNSSVKSSGKVHAVVDEYDEVEGFLKNKKLMDVLGSTFVVVRLGSYTWNMRRLDRKTALAFATIIEKDWKKYEKMGYLDPNRIDAEGLYIVKSLAIRHPRVYLNVRPVYEFRNRFRVSVVRFYKKFKNGLKGNHGGKIWEKH